MGESSTQASSKGVELFLQQSLHVAGVSVLVKTSLCPLERIKIIQQTQFVNTSSNQISGIMNGFNFIVKNQGVKQLWRSNIADIIKMFPTSLTRYLFYDYCANKFLTPEIEKYALPEWVVRNFLCSFSISSLVMFFSYPLENARTRLASDLVVTKEKFGLYIGTSSCLSSIFTNEGPRSLWKGFLISWVSMVPYYSVGLVLHRYLKQQDNGDSLKYMQGTGLACTLTSLAVYPFDTIRRRMMINNSVGYRHEYKSSLDCIKKIMKQEGFSGFYKGCTAHVLKLVPAMYLQFWLYDVFQKQWISSDEQKREKQKAQ